MTKKKKTQGEKLAYVFRFYDKKAKKYISRNMTKNRWSADVMDRWNKVINGIRRGKVYLRDDDNIEVHIFPVNEPKYKMHIDKARRIEDLEIFEKIKSWKGLQDDNKTKEEKK